MSDFDAMIAERNAMEVRLIAERKLALSRCRSRYEAEQCTEAYHKLMYAEGDVIEQRHGYAGRRYRLPAHGAQS